MACQIEAARPASRPHHQPLPPSLSWVEEELDALGTANLLRPRRLRSGRQAGTVSLDGRSFVNCGANDYLGYAGDPRLVKAAAKGACSEGAGAGASPLVSGHSHIHEALAASLADLLGADDAKVTLAVERFVEQVLTQAEQHSYTTILITRADRPFISRILFGSEADRVARMAKKEGLGHVIIDELT